MELIQEIITNPTTALLETNWSDCPEEDRGPQRRIEPRIPTNRLTSVYTADSSEPQRMFCKILDVSPHGMRVRTARPLTTGTQVRVTLREVSAIAKVRYCNRVDDGFDHGLQIQELDTH